MCRRYVLSNFDIIWIEYSYEREHLESYLDVKVTLNDFDWKQVPATNPHTYVNR
jgi:hypothetical protein